MREIIVSDEFVVFKQKRFHKRSKTILWEEIISYRIWSNPYFRNMPSLSFPPFAYPKVEIFTKKGDYSVLNCGFKLAGIEHCSKKSEEVFDLFITILKKSSKNATSIKLTPLELKLITSIIICEIIGLIFFVTNTYDDLSMPLLIIAGWVIGYAWNYITRNKGNISSAERN